MQTRYFTKWLKNLKDKKAKVAIMRRLDKIQKGYFGDYKNLGGYVSELRFFMGAGYRIYFAIRGDEVILLLTGGDKSTQNKDIKKAKEILQELKQ